MKFIKRWNRKELRSPEYYMEEARKEAMQSNCQQTHWGAVLVNWKGEIIGRGFNYVPNDELFRHCKPCVRKYIRSCTQHEMCSARHAEVLCLENSAAEHGVDAAADGDMYLYGYSEIEGNDKKPIIMELYPCMDCAKAMISFKVSRVWFYRPTANTSDEELYLPAPTKKSKLDITSMRKYELDYIEGKQLWFHPSLWLGLVGETIKDSKFNYKLGQKFRPIIRKNKAHFYIQNRLGEHIMYYPDDEEITLMVWIVEQVIKDGYFDFSEYEFHDDKKMAFPKLHKVGDLDKEVVTVEWIQHNFQIRRMRDDVRKTDV